MQDFCSCVVDQLMLALVSELVVPSPENSSSHENLDISGQLNHLFSFPTSSHEKPKQPVGLHPNRLIAAKSSKIVNAPHQPVIARTSGVLL